MPPEPLPFWDRKERKPQLQQQQQQHERVSVSESLGSVGRWRDSNSSMISGSHHGSREFIRWGSTEFRRPPGHGKQGGWHMFSEESGHGYGPYRSGNKMLEDESFRPRGDGKYARNGREGRGSFSQREWRGNSWDASNVSLNMTVRPLQPVNNNNQRSVDDMLTSPPPPHPDFVNTWDQIHLKDQQDNKMGGVNGMSTGQRSDRENSLDWKPLKWTRSGSLSSRGSGFSHSSSSKSLGGVDSRERKAELQPKSATPVQSPSGDAVACVTSAPSEDTTSRKKPRLGWGEGLAKYEKKKVEPDLSVNKDGAAVSASNSEPVHSLSSNLAEKSPRVLGFSDCASPATPSSVACSSSPGVEEKSFGKAANADNDVSNLCSFPVIGTQNHLEGFAFNLENLNITSVANLGSSLFELLQADDQSSLDSSFVRSTAMNKLLILKAEISKDLEMTESEIDSRESELKLLKSESQRGPCPATSSSVLVDNDFKPCDDQGATSNSISRSAPFHLDSCGNAVVDNRPLCIGDLGGVHADGKDEDTDSPGTATSKFSEALSLVKVVSPSDMVNSGECFGDLDSIQSKNMEVKCVVPGPSEEQTGVSACGDGSTQIRSISCVPVDNMRSHLDGGDALHNLILASNRDLANKASEVFNHLLPGDGYKVGMSGVINVPCLQNESSVKEKFVKKKQFLRFKERVLTLKFKAFRHLWKEDVRLLSIRKYGAKSQKKCESSLRTINGGYQKHRSSIRSRFSSPAGNLSLVPTTEMINFTSKLLSDSQVKLYRDCLKMPALVLDKREKLALSFLSNNGFVDDPCAVEKERAMINPWTSTEKEVFMEKLATFGKNFKRIASFLDHKTTADCVEFYYKNHKSDCFEKTKKLDLSKQGKSSTNTYLVTSGKKWNRNVNAASLDMLGAASMMAAHADCSAGNRKMCMGRIILGGQNDLKRCHGEDSITVRSSNFDFLGNERETAAAVDVLAGICGSLSSEAMSSCITSSVDPGEAYREWRCQKVDSIIKRPSTSDVTQNVDDETCSDESCGEMDPADWTDEEKSIFIQAVSSYGKDFALISRCVRTKSRNQCKVFFSKARKCLGLDLIRPGHGNVGTPASDDANGGGSGTEDACVLETSSVICSNRLDSKMEEDLSPYVMNINHGESDPGMTMNLQSSLNRSVVADGMGQPHLGDAKATEIIAPGMCQTDDRGDLVLEHQICIMKAGDKESDSVHTQRSAVVSVHTESGRDEVTAQLLCEAIEPENEAATKVSTEGYENGMIEGRDILHEVMLKDKQNETLNVDSSCQSDFIQDQNTAGNASHLDADMNSCPEFSCNPEGLHQVSIQNPSVMSLTQLKCLASANSATIQSEKVVNQDRLLLARDHQESRDMQGHKSVRDDYHQHIVVNSLMNHVESSQILSGYPLQIQSKKEMNGELSCRSLSDSDRNISVQHLSQNSYLQKCNSAKAHGSVTGLALLSQSSEQTIEHPRVHLRSLSDTEKPSRNGVKLFGKIIRNSSSVQKPNLSANDSVEKGTHHPKLGRSSNMKFTGHHNVDGNMSVLKFDRSDYLGLENAPRRSHGFWDGNRIQIGFPSMPDSAILLAKYPAAFSNFPASSSKVEQHALQAVAKSSECNLNGASVFPPREMSNVLVDYPLCGNRDGKMHPFTVDMKQRQDLFAEMQRRNGFEAISSLQQQGRGLVGMNVVGRGGILVGGPCTGVSDPVAAIKMHYAKSDQYGGGQGGSILREEESWRGKGDIGR
ncbi:Myb_DNA-binding domain-containing protein [Cephalotus follicularis]|uniref:Myb_DNA-binding domain-containing protein n=1 Tax=Cephalotus follicularis TaxID=3775 RepID=A0A1Q3BIB3_CEPFO|nr:Myb_DNA-binding domain-containing protein [Cephalotus follicularis]